MKKTGAKKLYVIIVILLFFSAKEAVKVSAGKESLPYKGDKTTIPEKNKNNEPSKKYDCFKPGQIWKDNNGVHINAHGGGLLFYDDTYYWFGEHKIRGRKGNTAQVGVHCYSSKDIYNWLDEGIVLKVSEDPKSDIGKGCILERPKVIYNKKTNKFVMWFHLELKSQRYKSARSGVAVSDTPAGPYTFLNSFLYLDHFVREN